MMLSANGIFLMQIVALVVTVGGLLYAAGRRFGRLEARLTSVEERLNHLSDHLTRLSDLIHQLLLEKPKER